MSRPFGWSKPEHAPIAHPSILDIAWAAGIFEGEGTCRRSHGVKDPYGSMAITVGQKERWILDKLRDLFGGRVSISKAKPNSNIPSGPQHIWYVGGSRGRGFILTIFTFLSPRRRAQARRALGV